MNIREKVKHITDIIKRESRPVPAAIPSKIQSPSASGAIFFGKATANWTSGTTITLDPCDITGTDNGKANETVYVQASKASYTIANSAQIDQNTVCAYVKGDDDYYYLVGTPITVLTEFNINTSTYKFQTKTKDVWAFTESGESGYVDEHTGTVCS